MENFISHKQLGVGYMHHFISRYTRRSRTMRSLAVKNPLTNKNGCVYYVEILVDDTIYIFVTC